MSDWRWIDNDTPRDQFNDILLYYKNWLGGGPMVVSGHWLSREGREFEATWEHSWGYGDADMWMPLPQPPDSK